MNEPRLTNDFRAPTGRVGCFSVAVTAMAASLVALLLLALALYLKLPDIREGLQRKAGVGQRLPALDLQPLTGAKEPVTLETLKGKVVLVNLWGTWCPPCRAELPHLAKLRTTLAAEPDFVLLAVSCGEADPEDLMELEANTAAFLENAGLDLPTYADPDMTTRQALARVAGFKGYPTSFVLDRDGVIRAIWEGYAPGLVEEIRQRVLEILEREEGR
jgi:thiol-disulfide isomerase/thioredoxin